jgi:hypothetical protein
VDTLNTIIGSTSYPGLLRNGSGYTMLYIDNSHYYVFVALCIVVIVVSLIKIAVSNENIERFREYFAVGYCAPDPSFF